MKIVEAVVETRVCGFEGYVSQHPNIFVTEFEEEHHGLIRKTGYSIKNIDMDILRDMSLSLTHYDLGLQMVQLYNTVEYNKCLSDSKLVGSTLALANLDPNSLGLSIFRRLGHLTKLSGEVAYVVKCKPHKTKIRKTVL